MMETTEPATAMPPAHHHAPHLVHRSPLRFSDLLMRSLAGGFVLWLAYVPTPIGWLGWLAWIALIPWLSLVRCPCRARSLYGAAYLGGFFHFGLALNWMRVAHPMMVAAWLALAAYCALYVPLTLALLRRFQMWNLPLTLTTPIVWVSLDYLRAHAFSGFAWFFLGHTQHDWLHLIQIADLGGVYAVSTLIASANGLWVDWIQAAYRRPQLIGLTLSVVASVGGAWLYGHERLAEEQFAPGPKISLLQTNVSQDIRNERTSDAEREPSAAEAMIRSTKELTDALLARRDRPDLIVWPETSFADDWFDVVPGTPETDQPDWLPKVLQSRRELVGSVARYSQAHVLLGLNTSRYGPGMRHDRFNSALLVTRDGIPQQRYDKIHCVPFGEYIPFRETLPFMKVFSPYGDYDYSLTPGECRTRFRLDTAQGPLTFGVLICYEDSDPDLARHYAIESSDGPAVDFLVNISNDGWFRGTEEHEIHLAICRFRAVEARRSVVRSVNMGISAVIDGSGRVVALPGASWRESKKVAGVVTAEAPLDRRTSWYARVGDVWAGVCAIATLLLFLGTIVSRHRWSL
jgi:apolipoprotein N-acyltransferase